jgi:hypothetical protein
MTIDVFAPEASQYFSGLHTLSLRDSFGSLRKEQNNRMTPSKAPLPFLGAWTLTTCETSRPDLPHLVSGLTTFTQEPDGIHYSNDGTWSDGRTSQVSAVVQLDGGWYPITGSLLADSLSLRILEDGSFEAKGKKNGVDVVTSLATVSANGRIMMSLWTLAGPNGATITWETKAERQ